MPAADVDCEDLFPSPEPLTELPFPPITKSHILNCSFNSWYSSYRRFTPKARLIPLSSSFLDYLRADGIVLPSEDDINQRASNESDSDTFSYPVSPASSETGDEEPDPSAAWLDIHQKVKDTIAELDGSVVPKLNWSAPKDATWISATNSMECSTPNDIYLLLKSSDFINHDLEHAFDDCESDSGDDAQSSDDLADPTESESAHPARELRNIPYHLVLRKTIPSMTTSLEFRCFVRARRLLCICQRDLNHYSFLDTLSTTLLKLIQQFFQSSLQKSFRDDSFVFDVYVPPPHGKVWLIDINPWAPRTDPLLFSWLEILEMNAGDQVGAFNDQENTDGDNETDDDVSEEYTFEPEFRLVKRDDPEAYGFSTPQYSAHKLPKDVVDASADGGTGLRDFMGQWREILARQKSEEDAED
ncbi:hypothetical protein MMC07_001117 [Pseudocyphellaria aurata]|nr:hypothetical protein [Pseudocyphellaria aurata]